MAMVMMGWWRGCGRLMLLLKCKGERGELFIYV